MPTQFESLELLELPELPELPDGYLEAIASNLIAGQPVRYKNTVHNFTDVVVSIWDDLDRTEAVEEQLANIAMGNPEAAGLLQALIRESAIRYAETFADALYAEELKEQADDAAIAHWENSRGAA